MATKLFIADWAAAGLDFLFPPRCANCDADLGCVETRSVLLCDACIDALGPHEWVGCSRCGAAVTPGSAAAATCPGCRGRSLQFDTVLPLSAYRDQVRSAVLKMKRPSGDPLAYAVGRLFHLRRKDMLMQLCPHWIAPIPMHWIRRAMRKTNSAELLARQIARGLGTPLATGLLRRVRNTRPQPGLSPVERFKNVRGAFEACEDYDLGKARILLVDDVLTTGATASEAASVLKRAGATQVAVAVVARAEGDDPL